MVQHQKGGTLLATTLKNVTCYIDKDLDNAIYAMRKNEKYMRCSKSELVRTLLLRGLEIVEKEEASRKSRTSKP